MDLITIKLPSNIMQERHSWTTYTHTETIANVAIKREYPGSRLGQLYQAIIAS